jgi:transcriptional regulator with XRE-family HTH domain
MALHEPETFGAVLRCIRQSKGLTQRDIARRIDMDFAYFSRLETDRLRGLPTRTTVEKIAQAMLEELVQQAEERLKRQRNTPRKRREGDDPSQNS